MLTYFDLSPRWPRRPQQPPPLRQHCWATQQTLGSLFSQVQVPAVLVVVVVAAAAAAAATVALLTISFMHRQSILLVVLCVAVNPVTICAN